MKSPNAGIYFILLHQNGVYRVSLIHSSFGVRNSLGYRLTWTAEFSEGYNISAATIIRNRPPVESSVDMTRPIYTLFVVGLKSQKLNTTNTPWHHAIDDATGKESSHDYVISYKHKRLRTLDDALYAAHRLFAVSVDSRRPIAHVRSAASAASSSSSPLHWTRLASRYQNIPGLKHSAMCDDHILWIEWIT
jgi:hypothetical protein